MNVPHLYSRLSTLLVAAVTFGAPARAEEPARGPIQVQVGADIPVDNAANPPPPDRRYVAVVVGLSSYANLPDEVELDFARSDAATVAQALEERAGFTKVFLLADREATREGIREIIRVESAQMVGPNDLFLLYFVGHGIGADLGMPTLLAHDSTLAGGLEDGLEMSAFATEIETWTRAGTTLIVTDAIHRNQLDGIYFYGPAANQWPTISPGMIIISSSQAESPGKDGAFGTVFADAMSGAADKNKDAMVTAAELFGYLTNRVAPAGQIPVVSGDFSWGQVVANGVTPGLGARGMAAASAEPVYPDYDIWSAKFVFDAGIRATVQCRDAAPKTCDPICYVRNFEAGPCELTTEVSGQEQKGRVVALVPGKYSCGMRSGQVVCTPPLVGAETSRPTP